MYIALPNVCNSWSILGSAYLSDTLYAFKAPKSPQTLDLPFCHAIVIGVFRLILRSWFLFLSSDLCSSFSFGTLSLYKGEIGLLIGVETSSFCFQSPMWIFLLAMEYINPMGAQKLFTQNGKNLGFTFSTPTNSAWIVTDPCVCETMNGNCTTAIGYNQLPHLKKVELLHGKAWYLQLGNISVRYLTLTIENNAPPSINKYTSVRRMITLGRQCLLILRDLPDAGLVSICLASATCWTLLFSSHIHGISNLAWSSGMFCSMP